MAERNAVKRKFVNAVIEQNTYLFPSLCYIQYIYIHKYVHTYVLNICPIALNIDVNKT